MFRGVIARTTDFIFRTGNLGILCALISIFAFGANLILINGGTASRTLAIGIVVILIATGLLAILARLIDANRNFRRAEDRIRLYCQAITDSTDEAPWRVVSWEDKIDVSSNGDSTEEITVQVRVTGPDFQFVRVTNGSGHTQPKRLRRLVQVETSKISVSNGSEDAPWFITKSWKKDDKLEVLAHCGSKVSVGSIITLRLYYWWPKKCSPLMSGEEDIFRLRFRSGLENLDYTVTVPGNRVIDYSHIDGPDLVRGLIEIGDNPINKTRKIHLSAKGIAPGFSVGMKVRVKGASARRHLLPLRRGR